MPVAKPLAVKVMLCFMLRAPGAYVLLKPPGQVPLRKIGAECGTAIRIIRPLADEYLFMPGVTIVESQAGNLRSKENGDSKHLGRAGALTHTRSR
jgi:hypothetical protein